PSLEPALEAAAAALEHGPISCDLMDRRLLSLARTGEASAIAGLIPADAEAIMLVEFEDAGPAQASGAAAALVEDISRCHGSAIHVLPAYDSPDVSVLRQLRDSALPSLFNIKGGAQPLPFVEDVAVPLDSLAEYLHRLQAVFQEHETTAA